MGGPVHDGSPRVIQANLRALRRKSPAAASVLARWAEGSGSSNEKVRIIDTPSGFPSLELAGAGLLHSRYDPVREADAWAARLSGSEHVVVVYGLGLAYHVEALFRSRHPVRIVVIEPEPAVAWAALCTRRLDSLLGSPRFQLLLTEPRHDFLSQLEGVLLSGVVAGGWTLHAFPSYARLYPERIKALHRLLVEILRIQRGNLATYHRWMQAWIDNVIANLRYVSGRTFIDHWFGVWRGQPAILVAAGPSVTPNVPLLATLKGKVPIVAAGSGLGPLVEAGVEPDLVVSIDSGEANYRHFEGRNLAAPLVFSPEIYPRILDEYRGPLIPMATTGGTTFPYLCHLAGLHPTPIPSGPSVANVTLALLHALGANPIILVGQDLAYPGGRSHAQGVPTVTDIDPGRHDLVRVEAVGGGQVLSDFTLQGMRHWIEWYVTTVPGLRVVNTSQGGARIRGTEEMELEEAVKRFRLGQVAGVTDAFSSPPPGDHQSSPVILDLEPAHLLRRVLEDVASVQRALQRVSDAGHRALTRLATGTRRASRVQASLADFDRRRRGLEKTPAYRYFLLHVLNYRRLILAQAQDDPEAFLKRYLDACDFMSGALEALRASASTHAGTP